MFSLVENLVVIYLEGIAGLVSVPLQLERWERDRGKY